MSESRGPFVSPVSGRDWRPWAGLALVALAVASFLISIFFLDLQHLLRELQERRSQLQAWVDANWLPAAVLFVLIYVVFTSLSLPGSVFLTLAGGALFGFWWGIVLINLASTAGAIVAFLSSRYLLRDYVEAKYGNYLETIDRELEREGAFYLFALRLNPVIPYFLINLVFGLTRMPLTQFWWVSQLGMLPATAVYVNAGSQLATVESLESIWPLLASLVVLSLFPVAARVLVRWLRRARRRRGEEKV